MNRLTSIFNARINILKFDSLRKAGIHITPEKLRNISRRIVNNDILSVHSSVFLQNHQVKAIVAYEPGQIVLPDDLQIKPVDSKLELVRKLIAPHIVPKSDFMKLTKMPILIIYGDNISTKHSKVLNEEVWRISLQNAKTFVNEINKNGGDATLIELPKVGLHGNTHAAFADLNNKEVLKVMTDWLAEKGLSRSDRPHTGQKSLIVRLRSHWSSRSFVEKTRQFHKIRQLERRLWHKQNL